MHVLNFKNNRGFTLTELILALILISILAAVSMQLVGSSDDALRYEETRKKMELIRAAILGDESLDTKGQRWRFGYHGDMGALPTALDSLIARGSQPLWSYNPTYGIGVGWRGPYIAETFTNASPIDRDAWGNSFQYVTTALVSLGADAAGGGVLFAKDLSVPLTSTYRLSSVRGFVRDGVTRIPNARVEIRHPANAAVNTQTTLTHATDGYFLFNSVPFGPASLQVTSIPTLGLTTLGPRTVVVDAHQFMVPNDVLNFFGFKQRVIQTGAVTLSGSNEQVNLTFSNTAESNLSISYITAYWSGGANFLNIVRLNGTDQNVTPGLQANCAASGTRLGPFASTLTATGNSTANAFRLTFATVAAGCTGTPNMSAVNFYVLFEWTNTAQQDALGFAAP